LKIWAFSTNTVEDRRNNSIVSRIIRYGIEQRILFVRTGKAFFGAAKDQGICPIRNYADFSLPLLQPSQKPDDAFSNPNPVKGC
jgi:hypothetical protein